VHDGHDLSLVEEAEDVSGTLDGPAGRDCHYNVDYAHDHQGGPAGVVHGLGEEANHKNYDRGYPLYCEETYVKTVNNISGQLFL